MANLLYPKAKEALLNGEIDLVDDTIGVVLVDLADYAYNAVHQWLSQVPAAARVGTPQALSSKTTTDGVFDAADVLFTEVVGDPCEAILLYKWTGDAATSRLIALIDQAVGLPITPSGVDVPIIWANGPSKIFAL